MSAWDIAGACIATPLSLWLWATHFRNIMKARKDGRVASEDVTASFLVLGWAIFCIARLCGAHL